MKKYLLLLCVLLAAGSFAQAFKESGAGKVIGEETGGMNVAYGDLLPYYLPVSGITLCVPYKCFWLFKADDTDIHGVLPDYPVGAGEALSEAYKLIKKSR